MSLFTDFLTVLKVPHTSAYSDKAFKDMPFKSLFGCSRLLASYGVESEGVTLSDKTLLARLPVPYIARDKHSFVIVTGIHKGQGEVEDQIDFIRFGKRESVGVKKFSDDSTGIVLLASAGQNSREPDYTSHHLLELAEKGKVWILVACAIFLVFSGFVVSGLWDSLSAMLLAAVDFAGIFVTWLLLLKSLKVKSRSADRICGVLQEHGCDHVLEQKASTFFGIFSWSEVGITYFSLSTLLLFLFPSQIHNLALINGCCLPFTVWSIWYQKFRIKTWCTLCVTTQCLLWLQFFCYLAGGWWKDVFPIGLPFFMMVATYGAVLMAVNKVVSFIKRKG